jgi:hypothetical protein
MPKGSREYFDTVNSRSDSGIKFKTMFDFYYLCLILGLDNAKLGKKESIESGDFLDYFPDQYSDKGKLIIGMFIEAEMRRRDILYDDRKRVESLMVELIDEHSVTNLQPEAMERLNQYAAKGMELIKENIAKTSELETFFIQYFELIDPGPDDNNLSIN